MGPGVVAKLSVAAQGVGVAQYPAQHIVGEGGAAPFRVDRFDQAVGCDMSALFDFVRAKYQCLVYPRGFIESSEYDPY